MGLLGQSGFPVALKQASSIVMPVALYDSLHCRENFWSCLLCPLAPVACIALLVLGQLFLSGCTPVYQVNDPGFRLARQELASSFSRRARQMESRQELEKALLDWQIAGALDPDNDLARARAEVLRRQVREKAQSAYRAGLAALEQRAWGKAAEAFVLSLTYDSGSQEALRALRSLWRKQNFVAYELKSGDKAATVARKLYQDQSKAELVAYFLDTRPQGQAAGGKSKILLPRIPPPSARAKPVQQASTGSSNAVSYETVKTSSDRTEASSPADKQATYQKGRTLIEQNRPQEALRALRSIDPGYRDTQDWIARLEQHIQEKVKAHYRKGLIHFLAEDLDAAIQEWEMALSLSPDHEAARMGLEKARRLQEHLENYP